ncbi:MAG: hypothetical protein COU67_00035 [Candidatus Pacebacteria bacterium CG10_big_fil_rev_8_21_14_0_10_44_54]|nr:MAG: hypothetical protein COU67_00035 [Candidatus Pacebacteria bacterium CG10_big_fil_rev_8_21_14_0_10_44_54]
MARQIRQTVLFRLLLVEIMENGQRNIATMATVDYQVKMVYQVLVVAQLSNVAPMTVLMA